MIVRGAISYDAAMMPRTGDDDARGARVPGRIRGEALSRAGFASPFDAPVTLDVGCAGPWCGTLGTGDQIAFLRQDPGGWTLDVGPCPSAVFEASPEIEAEVMACMSGACAPS